MKLRVFGITQTGKEPGHDSQYMCNYKMVQLRGPCMDLDWPKNPDFNIILHSDHLAAVKDLTSKLEIALGALGKYENCICDDGDTYAAREAIKKIEAL